MKILVGSIIVLMMIATMAQATPTFGWVHHSNGGLLMSEGDVLNEVQTIMGETVVIHNYGGGGTYMATDPYDLYLFITGSSSNKENWIAANDVFGFKSCYTGAQWLQTENDLDDFKMYYTAIIDELQTYTTKRFFVIGFVPLREQVTTYADAVRHKEAHDWLAGECGGNVWFFPYFHELIDTDLYLKDAYERPWDPQDPDLHVNTAGNEYLGPLFAQFLVDVYEYEGGGKRPPWIPHEDGMIATEGDSLNTTSWGSVKTLYK